MDFRLVLPFSQFHGVEMFIFVFKIWFARWILEFRAEVVLGSIPKGVGIP